MQRMLSVLFMEESLQSFYYFVLPIHSLCHLLCLHIFLLWMCEITQSSL